MSVKLRPKRTLVCALALGLLAPGCRNTKLDATVALAMSRNQRKARAEGPRPEREVKRDPRTGQVLEDRRRTSYGPRGYRNEGPQRTWYPGGAPESFREFAGGEPTGHWVTWWRTGSLRSSYVFDPDRDTRMVWWHANGVVASEGMARMGQRVGPWEYRWEHGAMKSEGSYVGGRRDGPWTFYDEDGEWTERGRFVSGDRVGDWEVRGQR
ncbi:MAG: hypothetical protein VX015_06370 [Planctomycetota bacterium]|nr:hypothetical protein [Planctomycetota bacterium]MEC8511752.1 hypothetical protein [Planctomycetota bacterium]